MTTTVIHPSDRGKPVTSSYVTLLCSKCRSTLPGFKFKIYDEHVCNECYYEYIITYNPVNQCPYKKPRDRRIPERVNCATSLSLKNITSITTAQTDYGNGPVTFTHQSRFGQGRP